ncbi:shufflon system plasmid conjugative transfer pilus tip adhesin PilV [Niveispirillum sp. SYP-B3756]|uniref:shufflon system plasmid conjugative transfer pilus tip adhesin PilV n=1 Tax=Niveispirillum sp. SYP-B3756 TaxID=2662178 RepID=UPI0012917945|nr:shufflon system plasmid conjugative transfer pilus tip adhesin PilV [Niveispirillum sp. SYP-B3756]MQP68217.1 shufflon system plasmid conjugative transfer pilus tip adhesin PilV [Niveispirillum sp. SYP-B3756]
MILSKDLALGLVILAGVSTYFSQLSSEASNRRSDQIMSAQLSYFNRESAKFIQSNMDYIENEIILAGKPISYSASLLKSRGYLQNFKDINLFGQRFCLAVRRAGPGSLEALAATIGGAPIPPDRAVGIAADVRSGSGGSIQPENSSIAVGGAWAMALSDFAGGGCLPEVGHLAGNLAFEEGRGVITSYAHRMPVTGMTDSATFRQAIILDSVCDDPTTPAIETNAPCALRAIGQAPDEPGFELNRIRMINNLINRTAAKGETCSPMTSSYAISAAGIALMCNAEGLWSPIPSQGNFVKFW